jgi:hypothetical protein
MDLEIAFDGDVVDRLELLNGTQSVDIEGADANAGWTLASGFSWNLGLIDFAGEGDLALTRNDGAEIFGVVARARVHEGLSEGAPDAGFAFDIEYEIDGGSGEFEGARGTARAAGTLAGTAFHGVWGLTLESP